MPVKGSQNHITTAAAITKEKSRAAFLPTFFTQEPEPLQQSFLSTESRHPHQTSPS